MESTIEAFTFEEKQNCLLNLLPKKENIYLYGSGNNGKTFVVKSTALINDTYNHFHQYESGKLQQLIDYKSRVDAKKLFLIESNVEPNEEIINSNFKIIKFNGCYNKSKNIYE